MADSALAKLGMNMGTRDMSLSYARSIVKKAEAGGTVGKKLLARAKDRIKQGEKKSIKTKLAKGGTMVAKKKMRGGGMAKMAKKKMMRGGVAAKKMRGGGMAKMAKKKMMRGGMAKKK